MSAQAHARAGGAGRGGGRKKGLGTGAHLVNPVDVGGHAGEDRGLLERVAAQAGAEADDAPHLPDTVLSLAVQRAARVPLCRTGWSLATGPPHPQAGSGGRGGRVTVGETGWRPLFWPPPVHGGGGAEEMWFGGARLALRLLWDLGTTIALSGPQFP